MLHSPARKNMLRPSRYLIDGYEGMKAREARMPAPSKKEVAAAAARIVPFFEAWGKMDKASQRRKRLNPPAS